MVPVNSHPRHQLLRDLRQDVFGKQRLAVLAAPLAQVSSQLLAAVVVVVVVGGVWEVQEEREREGRHNKLVFPSEWCAAAAKDQLCCSRHKLDSLHKNTDLEC